MADYKPNSHKSKEAYQKEMTKQKTKKVVSAPVRTKKKSEFQKIAGAFISEDVDNVKSYIIGEVLIPTIKKAVSEIITTAIDMLLYGDAEHNKKRSGETSRFSYGNCYVENDRGIRTRQKTKTGYNFENIVFNNRGDAEKVLANMDELISRYGLVSVADLYDLVGITGNYTDDKYGWTDIHEAYVYRIRDGWAIKLPRAYPLD